MDAKIAKVISEKTGTLVPFDSELADNDETIVSKIVIN